MIVEKMNENDKRLMHDAFKILKVVCDTVMQNPTCENITDLLHVINGIQNSTFNYLWEYVIYPIQFHLLRHNADQRKLHSNILLKLLQCFKKIISDITIDSTKKFIELNILVLRLITVSEEHELATNVPEEIKYAVIDCLYSLYKSLDQNLLDEIYNFSKNYLIHARNVYVCIQIIKNETLLNLRIISFQCILTIIKADANEYTTVIKSNLKNDLSDTVATMLPGIISMCYFVTSTSMLHHSLYIYSLRVFSSSVASVFALDDSEKNTSFASNFNELLAKEKFHSDICSQNKNSLRTDEWYANTTQKLFVYSESLIYLCCNTQWKVRLEAAKAANRILLECSCRIISVLTKQFEILVVLSEDTIEHVAKEARSCLDNLLKEKTLRSEKLLESLNERLFHLLAFIDSSLNSMTEDMLLTQLNLLNGYLSTLDLKRIFKSSIYRESIFRTLVKIVHFDPSSIITFQEHVVTALNDSFMVDNFSAISWKNTKYLNCQMETTVKHICCTIAGKVNVEGLTFYLLYLFENCLDSRKEVLYLINNVIFNEQQKYAHSSPDLCKTVFNTYLDPALWSIPLAENENGDFVSISSWVVQNNLIQVCLLVEGIGNMALCLGQNFKPYLVKCLYKLIEKAGSTNRFLSSVALESIKKITEACNYSNLIELIADNVEFITYNLCWKLRNLKHHTRVFDVFCVVIMNSEKDSLPLLFDIMQTSLESDSLLQDAYCENFLRIFKVFTRKLRSWFSPVFRDDCCSLTESSEKHLKFLLGLHEFVNQIKERKENFTWTSTIKDESINLNDIFENNEDNVQTMNDETVDNFSSNVENSESKLYSEKEEVDIIPQHVELTVSIAIRILNLLPHKSVLNKIMIIDILADSLLILCDRDEQLLPLVHKTWTPLVNRLKYDNSDPLIMRRCFELLCVIAAVAKDFIRTRTLKDILPIINKFLLMSAEDSRLKDKNSVYRMSQKYKLQFTLLSELGYLAVYICLQEKDIHSILVAVTPYLSSKQPLPLQNACVKMFNIIKHQHKDLVWIHLMSILSCEEILNPPSAIHFTSIKIDKSENNEDCAKNVTILQEDEASIFES